MILSRTTSENILLNKHEIKRLVDNGLLVKGLPLVDSANPQHIDEIQGNQLRALKNYPAAFDFLVNFINDVWATSPTPYKHFKRIDKNYWKTIIFEPTWKEYFLKCGDHTIRQNLATQVLKDLQNGYIIIKGQDKKGRYIEQRAPFRIMARRVYENGIGYREVFLSDAVFGSLITMDCTKRGGGGFIEIQPTLYPLLTCKENDGVLGEMQENGRRSGLKSFNPVYRLNILGLSRNTHKKKNIRLPRQEFIESIVPEYIDCKGNLEISSNALRQSLEKNMTIAQNKIPQGLLVKNYYLGCPGEETTIYFRQA